MFIDVEGGRTFIQTGGKSLEPSATSLVMIHGAGLDQLVWWPLNGFFLRHGFNVVAPDLPGHGKSERPRPIDTIEGYADWVMAATRALGLERIVPVGHSMGALIALELARRTSCEKLVLMAVADTMPVHPSLLDSARSRPADAASFMAKTGFGPRGHLGPSALAGSNLLAVGQRLFENARNGILFDDLQACNDYKAAVGAASAITCPTLLMLGELDRMTPARRCRELRQAFANAETHILPRTGHMIMLEALNDTQRLMLDFLRR